MHPILTRYGPFFLYSYTVVLGLGIMAGLGLAAWRAGAGRTRWMDGALVALVVGLAGGRAVFVLSNYIYFEAHPGEMALIWLGGLSYHGALLAGLAGLWLWARWQGRPFGYYAGLLAAPLALASAAGWLACWMEGCAYGRETVLGLLAADLPDSFGVFGLRYQTQLLGIAGSLLVLGLVFAPWWRGQFAFAFWLGLFGLSAVRLLINLLRGDPALMVAGWRLDTLVDGGLALFAAGVLLVQWRYSVFGDRSSVHTRPVTEYRIPDTEHEGVNNDG